MESNNNRRPVSVMLPAELMAALRARAEAAGQSLETYCEAALAAAVRELFEPEE